MLGPSECSILRGRLRRTVSPANSPRGSVHGMVVMPRVDATGPFLLFGRAVEPERLVQ